MLPITTALPTKARQVPIAENTGSKNGMTKNNPTRAATTRRMIPPILTPSGFSSTNLLKLAGAETTKLTMAASYCSCGVEGQGRNWAIQTNLGTAL